MVDKLTQWYRICNINEGWTNIHDKNQSATLVSNNMGQMVDEKFKKSDGLNI